MDPWICPRCGRVNAPWKDHCDCTAQETTASSGSACDHKFLLILDSSTESQYVCTNCGKIKIRAKRGDTDGDY